ncbi:hypothetical protein N0B51_10290 [Tsuneonella sp. YG55]|uniref:Lipoprotein n=1 Tax=Tsuneonella litorea TaxID=2976475 RepID=A0A9X3AN81_9SPHN|nr:hypothetical protein [Tsuneonella litorea]MCT2559367.1 hypothetical protein [Tsuneonella litorea]
MTMRVVIARLAIAAGVLSLTAPAAAQAGPGFRSGTPPVLTPPPRAVDTRGFDEARSAAEYRRVGSPRIVVFWNRELSDRIANDYDAVMLERGEAASGAASAVSRNGRYAEGAQVSAYERETRIGKREVTDDSRGSLLDEDEEWSFLEAFQGRLQSAGVRLVDRNLAMRSIAAQPGGPLDKQSAEMSGITRLADLMLAIVQTPADGTPLGVRFKVTVTDLRTGTILATLVDDGDSRAIVPGRFVAGATGFEREHAAGVDAGRAGSNLASTLLARMAGAWL